MTLSQCYRPGLTSFSDVRVEPLLTPCKVFIVSFLLSHNTRVYRRFHGRGRHLVGRAKNSDGLGRVIVSV